ncbi:FtsX-like permease family protein [Micromonospora echinaurantiaca]|uniref:FtsX-like permease family protein n=1 Tax=Micromonospora echinaurantiaca TaxID=47857 RepID=UPI0037BBE5D0
MLAVIAGALAARRAQALAVLLLAVLASAAAAAAPMYVAAAGQALASQELAVAGPDERRVRFSSIADYPGIPTDPGVAAFRGQVEPFAAAGFEVVLGAQAPGVAAGPAGTVASTLVFRQGICERVAVTGTCPAPTAGGQRPEVMVSTNTATHLGVSAGGELTFAGVPLRVTGVYRPLDPSAPYWLGTEYLPPPAPGPPPASSVGSARDAIFTGGGSARLADEDAILQRPTADLFVTERLVRTGSVDDLRAAVATASGNAGRDRVGTSTSLPDLLHRVTVQRDQLAVGVTLGAGLLVLLCWLVLFMAVSSAADLRRPEQGLLLLRGVQRRRLWTLAVGEHAVPALAAIPLGCLAGLAAVDLLAAHTLAGEIAVALDPTAVGYAALAAVGALAAVLLAQARSLSAPVVDLLRRVPSRVRGWRASIGDVVALSVAVAAVVQLRAGGAPSGLALLAPVVGALAVGVLLARLAMTVGAAVGARLLAGGRNAAGLALVQVARQPRFRPLIALLTVVVAMLAFTAATRELATAAYADRATVDVGAARVVGVDALSRKHLLDAVRAVDPEGRYAMAVVARSRTSRGDLPLLAVDSDRLAAVAAPHPSYGVRLSDIAGTLRPRPPAEPVELRGWSLTVVVTVDYDEAAYAGAEPRLFVSVASRSGSRRITADRPLDTGRGAYRVPVPECESPCRLVNFEIATPLTPRPLRVRFEELRVRAGDGDTVRLTAADFAEVGRWRASDERFFSLTAAGGSAPGLVLDVPEGRWPDPIAVAVADAPDVLPGWLTRSAGTNLGSVRYDALDSTPATALVAGFAARLPRFGESGLVLDLEHADRRAVGGQSGDKEVWLGRTAPADVLDRLRAQGLIVRYERTIGAERRTLASQAPALALGFNLFAALAGVLIGAAGLVAMAVAEQRNRITTMVALRRQGLSPRAVRGGYGWPVAVATAAGVFAAVAMWLLTRHGQRLFSDGRSSVPIPDWPDAGGLLLVTVPAVALFALAAAVLGRVLAASVRRRAGR